MAAFSEHNRRSHRALGKTHRAKERPPFESIALLLQGGGALGAYQAGVYEALWEAQVHPDWVAGISIGAINCAIIAGNAAQARVAKLREFWELVTSTPLLGGAAVAAWTPFAAGDTGNGTAPGISTGFADLPSLALRGDLAKGLLNQVSAGVALALGAPAFFAPRTLVPWLQPAGSLEATSYYDTGPLRSTLERLVDFDRINDGALRLSVGAVNVRTGNFVYFDNTTHRIGPEHVMASGALPPGFPAIEIEGEHYWDGGLVSNTPLQWVLGSQPQQDTLAFQVDLWNARGAFPRTMGEVTTRQKEIQYSSRTRSNSDRFKYAQGIRNTLAKLMERIPAELRDDPEFAVLRAAAHRKVYNIVQLIYRSKDYEGDSKDYEFSRQSMEDHWRAGYFDTVRTLRHPEVLERPRDGPGVLTFDLAQDGRE